METKSSVWDLKSLKNQAVQGGYVYPSYSYSFLIIVYNKKIPFFAVGLFSKRSQMTSKCGKNIIDTLTCGSCVTSLFLPHFDVICDLLLNRCMATWNLFVKQNGAIGLPSKNIASVMLTTSNLVFSVFSEKCQLLAKGRSWRKILF